MIKIKLYIVPLILLFTVFYLGIVLASKAYRDKVYQDSFDKHYSDTGTDAGAGAGADTALEGDYQVHQPEQNISYLNSNFTDRQDNDTDFSAVEFTDSDNAGISNIIKAKTVPARAKTVPARAKTVPARAKTVPDSKADMPKIYVQPKYSVNEKPIADAGDDLIVEPGTLVNLSAVGSCDPDDGISTYEWKQARGQYVELSDAKSAEPEFEAPSINHKISVLAFILTVTDHSGQKDIDKCFVNIIAPGEYVTRSGVSTISVNAGRDQIVSQGEQVELSAADTRAGDDFIAFYLWQQIKGRSVKLFDRTSMRPAFTAPTTDGPAISLTFELVVTFASGLKLTDTCNINVLSSNNTTQSPTAIAGKGQIVSPGDKVTLDGRDSTDLDLNTAKIWWSQTYGKRVSLQVDRSEHGLATFIAPSCQLTSNNWIYNNSRCRLNDSGQMEMAFKLTVLDNKGQESTDTCTIFIDQGGIAKTPVIFDSNFENSEIINHSNLQNSFGTVLGKDSGDVSDGVSGGGSEGGGSEGGGPEGGGPEGGGPEGGGPEGGGPEGGGSEGGGSEGGSSDGGSSDGGSSDGGSSDGGSSDGGSSDGGSSDGGSSDGGSSDGGSSDGGSSDGGSSDGGSSDGGSSDGGSSDGGSSDGGSSDGGSSDGGSSDGGSSDGGSSDGGSSDGGSSDGGSSDGGSSDGGSSDGGSSDGGSSDGGSSDGGSSDGGSSDGGSSDGGSSDGGSSDGGSSDGGSSDGGSSDGGSSDGGSSDGGSSDGGSSDGGSSDGGSSDGGSSDGGSSDGGSSDGGSSDGGSSDGGSSDGGSSDGGSSDGGSSDGGSSV